MSAQKIKSPVFYFAVFAAAAAVITVAWFAYSVIAAEQRGGDSDPGENTRKVKIEFRLLHPASGDVTKQAFQAYAEWNGDKQTVQPEQFFNTVYLKQYPDLKNYELLKRKNAGAGATACDLISRHTEMEVVDFRRMERLKTEKVSESGETTTRYDLRLEFLPADALRFSEVTRQHIGSRLAILVDGVYYSAPLIMEPIFSGVVQISGL